MKTIMRVLAVIILMLMTVAPVFSQGIWNSDEYSSGGFGTRSASGDNFGGDDGINDLAVGEERVPIQDTWEVIMIASVLYGTYLVRKHRRRSCLKSPVSSL
jgi:hypothetical protein